MSWDDGIHKKVKKIQLTFEDIINSIQIEYEGTTLKSQPRGTVGSKSDGFTLSSDEYIIEVSGSSRTVFSGDVITALTFKTNKKTYGPYGKQARNYFSIDAPSGKQIAGFLGTSGNALNSIDVHFAPIPPPGATEANLGSNESTPGTKPGDIPGTPGGGTDATPGTKPGGTGATPGTKPGGTGATSGTKPGGTGATPGSCPNNESNPQKLGPGGGKGGKEWDDTSNHEAVTKIYIVHGASGIEQVKFDYLKNGETKEGPYHGVKGGGSITTIEINHPKEYLVYVQGWYNPSNIIQGLRFVKNTKATYSIGYVYDEDDKSCTSFSFGVEGEKITGFHGFADSHLISIGAHVGPLTSTPLKPGVKKLDAIGGDEGELWDDGDFDDVRKVVIGDYEIGVAFVQIEYNKGSQVVPRPLRGQHSMTNATFKLDYANEYIIALRGRYEKCYLEGKSTTVVTNLTFVTNKDISRPYGLAAGKEFELGEKGHKIVGFHGKADKWVHQIGVYVAPITN